MLSARLYLAGTRRRIRLSITSAILLRTCSRLRCPWREDCWKEELEYERRPAVLVADADGIVRELVLLKERRCELDKESRELTKRIKELQKRLDPFFDEFGDRIMAGGVVIERVLVKVPERQQKAFEYHKYEVKLKG